jgi:homeobox protein cut-like
LFTISDPVSVLEYAQQIQKKAHRVGDLEIENKQLRETLDEYNHEFAEVKNQGMTVIHVIGVSLLTFKHHYIN